MSVYETVIVYKEKTQNIYKRMNVSLILKHLCCFGLSMLFSLSGFSEKFSPFGIAFAACVSRKFTVTASLGAALGYFFVLDSVNALRYTASVLALAVIIISLKSFKNISGHVATPVVVAFVSLFTTGLAVVLSQGVSVLNLLIAFCEAFVGGAAAFVLNKTKVYVLMRGGMKTLTSREITAIVISGTLLLLSFRYVNVFGVSVSHILASFAILLCSYYGKEAGGSVVGICCGVSISFGTNNLFFMSFYALGGLLSGVLSSFGKLCSVVAFTLSGALVAIISSYWNNLPYVLIETIISSVIFIIVSNKYEYTLRSFFSPSVTSPVIESVKSNIIDRLHKASEFSTEISTTLENVNDALVKSEKTNYSLIPQKVKDSVCSSCGLYTTCWKESEEKTKESFNKLLEMKRDGIYLQYKNIPVDFTSVCIRNDNVSNMFNKYFTEYKVKEKTEKRIKEIHSLATEQFVNVSDLLKSLCNEINEEVKFDIDVATRSKAVALSLGFEPIDCCCVVDSYEKTVIEMRVKNGYDNKKLNVLNSQLSVVSGKTMDYPGIERYPEYTKLIFKEKTTFKIISSAVQYNANNEKYSGDSYTTFQDDKGCFYALICDGMGTGARAAISSGMAVNLLEKLIKAGFGIESAIKTVNTSLVSKSGEECSVTLDLVVVDLYSGRTEFYKCGSQNTLVKRKNKISDMNFETLPLGILKNSDIGSGSTIIGSGDVIVMCSDGVRDEDFWQLRNAVKVFDNGNVRKFTTDISETIRRCQPEKKDDFTMITLAVINN